MEAFVRRLASPIVIPLALAACAPPEPVRAPVSDLAARAALELDCPLPWLRVTPVGPRTEVVDGCQKRAIYLEVCDDPSATCAWKNDTQPGIVILDRPAPAPAPATAWPAPAASAESPDQVSRQCGDEICGVR